MPKIIIQIEDADTKIIEQMFKTLDKHVGAWDVSTEKKEDAVCKIPSVSSGQSEAKKLADRQQYCICLLGSAVKVLENLQTELSKDSVLAGVTVRAMMQELKAEVTSNYINQSREKLSKEVNSKEARRVFGSD